MVWELKMTQVTANRSRIVAFDGFDSEFYNEWTSSMDDDRIVHERIAFQISAKKFLYA